MAKRDKRAQFVSVMNNWYFLGRFDLVPGADGEIAVITEWTSGVDVYDVMIALLQPLRCFVLDEHWIRMLHDLNQYLITERGERDRLSDNEHDRQLEFQRGRVSAMGDDPF